MPEQLSVVLQMDNALSNSLRADERVLSMLDAFDIDSPQMAVVVNDELRETIDRIKEIKAMKADFVLPAKQIIANAEKWFDPAIDARSKYEQGLRGKLSTWTVEQKRLADEARTRQEAEERRLRQEAEAKAAAERARAEQVAAEQRRQAQAAEEARQKAVAEGNAKAAAAAAAEAAKFNEKAAATLENADAKASETIIAAQAALPLAAVPEKVGGFALRDNWKSELLPGTTESDGVAQLVAGIAGVPVAALVRGELLPLLRLDMSAADKLAKALKKSMNVPGMQAVNRQTSVSRAA